MSANIDPTDAGNTSAANSAAANPAPETAKGIPVLEDDPIATILPPRGQKKQEELEANIVENGLLQPIVLRQGKILDGRHRYRICVKHGIPIKTVNYEGDSPATYAWSVNYHHRNLTVSQIAACVVDLLPMLKAEAKARQRRHGGTAPGRTKTDSAKLRGVSEASAPDDGSGDEPEQGEADKGGKASEAAAEMVGVSARSIETAKALKKSNPALFEEVKAGKKKLSAAAKTLKAEKPRKQPLKLLEQLKGRTFDVIHGDLGQMKKKLSGVELECVLDEASQPGSVLLVTVAHDEIPPASFGAYKFKTALVLKLSKKLLIQALGISVNHCLLAIYANEKTAMPKMDGSVMGAIATISFINSRFGKATKLLLAGDNAPDDWTVVPAPESKSEKGGKVNKPGKVAKAGKVNKPRSQQDH